MQQCGLDSAAVVGALAESDTLSTNTSMYCKFVATDGRDGSRREGIVVEELEGWTLALDWLVVGWVGLALGWLGFGLAGLAWG